MDSQDQPPDASSGLSGAARLAGRGRRWWRHAGRGTHALIEALGALLGLVIIAALALALRLAAAPLEVGWLTSGVVASIEQAIPPYHVSAQDTLLSWRFGHPTLDVRVEKLSVASPDGKPLLTIPAARVALNLGFLLFGSVVPVEVDLQKPVVHVTRSRDGEFAVSTDSATDDDTSPDVPITPFLRSFARTPKGGRGFDRLNRMTVTDAEIIVDDRSLGTRWGLTGGQLRLRPASGGLSATAQATLLVGDVTSPIRVQTQLDAAARRVTGEVSFDPIQPARLAAVLHQMQTGLGALQLPVSGRVIYDWDIVNARAQRLDAVLSIGAGSIVDARLAGGKATIEKGDAALSYVPGRLALDRMSVTLADGPTLTATATGTPFDLARLDAPVTVGAKLSLSSVPVERLPDWWPPKAAAGAREWIAANLSVGSVTAADFVIVLRHDSAAADPDAIVSADGNMTLSNLTVDYLDGLPKVSGVDATAHLGLDRIDFKLSDGHLLGLSVSGGSIAIDQLSAPFQHASIDVGIAGPAADVVSVLSEKRLGFNRSLGLEPADVGGTIDGSLHFGFLLKKSLTFQEIDYGASAKLSNFKAARVALGRDLDHGAFDLTLDHNHVGLDGAGQIDGYPATISWQQRLAGNAGPSSTVALKIRLDDPERVRLGVAVLPDFISGPVGVDLHYSVADPRVSSAQVVLDLADTTVNVDWVGWAKPPGEHGRASFRLDLLDQRITKVTDIAVTTADTSLLASADLTDNILTRIDIQHLTRANTDLSGLAQRDGPGAWRLALRGVGLDLVPVLKKLGQDKTLDADPADPGPTLLIDADLGRVTLGANRRLAATRFSGRVAAHTLAEFTLDGRYEGKGGIKAHLDPVGAGGKFDLTTDDFGSLFRLAGITDQIVGGAFSISGASHPDGDARRFVGHVEGSDYRLTNLPFMARLLSLASFETVLSLLSGDGIPFTTLKSDLSFRYGRLDLTHARAFGGAFGVNVDGWVDLKAGTLGLDGTLVPAYMLNSLLGKVPVVGDFLLGGKGAGIFAVNFALGGHIAEPQISVNPLSPFAPGVLRKLFLFDATAPEAKPDSK